jgi:hypothetical protein
VCLAACVHAAANSETLAAAQQVAAALLGGVTSVVLLENLLDAATIRIPDERQEVSPGGMEALASALGDLVPATALQERHLVHIFGVGITVPHNH